MYQNISEDTRCYVMVLCINRNHALELEKTVEQLGQRSSLTAIHSLILHM